MKTKIYITALVSLVFSNLVNAQNVGINTTGAYQTVPGFKLSEKSMDSSNVEGFRKKSGNQPNIINSNQRTQGQVVGFKPDSIKPYAQKSGPPPSVYAAPPNNACSNAISLGTVSTTTTVAGTNLNATADLWLPNCFYNTYQNVWYTFVVPATGGSYNITVTGGTIVDPNVAVIQMPTPCSLTGATQIGCNTSTGDGGTGTLSSISLIVNCLSAGTYYIMVDDAYDLTAGNTGTFNLTVTAVTPVVSNDCCTGALPISLASTSIVGSYTGTTTGTNVGATAETPNSSCFYSNKSVWYYFNAPVAGNYFVSVQGGSIVYPEISIQTGSCAALIEQSCAGAAGGSIYGTEHPYGFFAGSNTTPYAYGGICSATLNQRIYVMIDNYSPGSAGTFTLNVVTLKNDNINSGLIINSCGAFFSSSTIGATNCDNGYGDGYYNNLDNSTTICNGSGVQSGGDGAGNPSNAANPSVCINGGDVGYSVENDSWYAFCVTAVTTVTVTFAPTMSSCLPTPNGTYGLQIALFTGSPSSLTKVGGGYSGENITSSTTYIYTIAANGCSYIEVDGYAGTNCDYSLKVDLSPTCVLPIELLSFTADNQQGKIKLDWASATEINTDKYTIERSTDGTNYTQILSKKAKGNSTEQTNYSVYDENPIANSINYYKLNEFDFNGRESTLSQIAVSNKAGYPHFAVYPNPSNGKTTINISNFSSPSVDVEITDIYGRTVWSSTINLDNGTNLQQVDLSVLESGIYFVKATDENNKLYKQSLIISKNK